jgi:hypothetical protein
VEILVSGSERTITAMACNGYEKHFPSNPRLCLRGVSPKSLCLIAIAILCLSAGCHKKDGDQTPVIKYTPLQLQTPVHLGPATVEKFVDWVSTMPSSQIPDVKEQIAQVASDAALVDAVASRLSPTGSGSYGRQLIYLSILGETKNERAIGALANYLNSPDCRVVESLPPAKVPAGSNNTTYFDACAGLKSAAVNMIAYINSPAARSLVLQAVQNHASRSVRLSAMDAYLYNSHDSLDALALVRRYARRDEVKFVGLPRLAPQYSLKDFSERASRFYEEHPEERPALPIQVTKRTKSGEGRPDKSSVKPRTQPTQGESK